MSLKGVKIGFALTGSFCTIPGIFAQMEKLVEEGAEIIPIVSCSVLKTDTRFGKSADTLERLQKICKNTVLKSMVEVEPIGPGSLLDIMVVAPCTGNTVAKIANAITDTPVTMGVKAHLRNGKPVVLAISTNDALGGNAENIGRLLNTKNIFFVPFRQDSPLGKPNSLVAENSMLIETIEMALKNKQIEPLML